MTTQRYAAMNDVPPQLGTISDWYAQGRKVTTNAPVSGRVKQARLYHRDHTEPIPNLNEQAKANLAARWKCRTCGQAQRNPHGKALRLNGAQCATCQHNNP